MTFEFILLLVAGAAAGGFINGLAGFGTSLFALGWWLQIMPPVQAVAIVLAMSVFSGIQGVVLVRQSINWPRLGRFLVPAIFGIPLGLYLLTVLDPKYLKLVIAGFLILYGGFFTFRKDLPTMTRPTPIIDGVIGFLGGILGAAAGLSGALPTMWCSLRPWQKAEQRAVLQPFNVTILALSAFLLALQGAYTLETLIIIGVALPVTMVSAQIGIMVFKRLEDDQFRRLLIALMLVSGLVLMIRELI